MPCQVVHIKAPIHSGCSFEFPSTLRHLQYIHLEHPVGQCSHETTNHLKWFPFSIKKHWFYSEPFQYSPKVDPTQPAQLKKQFRVTVYVIITSAYPKILRKILLQLEQQLTINLKEGNHTNSTTLSANLWRNLALDMLDCWTKP